MRWFSISTASLWQVQLKPMIGGWVVLYIRSAIAGVQPQQLPALAGRVASVDALSVRLVAIGTEYVVPLAEIVYIVKPNQQQQEQLQLAAIAAGESQKGASPC